jgi:hypothetical protein
MTSPIRTFFFWTFVVLVTMPARPAAADEVVFLNGDRFTGKIISAADGKLILKTDGAGEVTIDLKKVKTFSSDEPVNIRVGDNVPFDSKIAPGPEGKIETRKVPGGLSELLAIKEIAAINPAPDTWHGQIALQGMIERGNTHRGEFGVTFELKKKWEADRLFFGGEFLYGRERDSETGHKFTADDYGKGDFKYSHDLTKKFYAEARFLVWHDSLAELNFRYATGPGLGYRWSESPTLTFFTEIGIAYNNENYETLGNRDYWGPYIAYGLEWTPVKPLKIFSDLEYLPSFSDFGGNYLVDVKGGIHSTIWKGLFVEFRVEYLYRSEPPGGVEKGDLRFVLGPGWKF